MTQSKRSDSTSIPVVGVLVVWRAVFMAGVTLSTPAAAALAVSAVGGVLVVCGVAGVSGGRVAGRVVVRGPGRAGQATRKGGRWAGPPFLWLVWAAVSYSPTPWRVQYHRRWQS